MAQLVYAWPENKFRRCILMVIAHFVFGTTFRYASVHSPCPVYSYHRYLWNRGIILGDEPTFTLFHFHLNTCLMCEIYSVCEHVLAFSLHLGWFSRYFGSLGIQVSRFQAYYSKSTSVDYTHMEKRNQITNRRTFHLDLKVLGSYPKHVTFRDKIALQAANRHCEKLRMFVCVCMCVWEWVCMGVYVCVHGWMGERERRWVCLYYMTGSVFGC